MKWLKDLLVRIWTAIKPDRVMCPTCLGSGCVECSYRGDIET